MIEHDEYGDEQYLKAPLDPALLPYADENVRLAVQLRALDLIREDNIGRLPPNVAKTGIVAIEADHPDGGPWLYTYDGVDAIVATRMRADGLRETTVLDEYGMPTEWRVVVVEKLAELDMPENPEFN
jgi:YD repeat-containing protein